MHRFYPSFATFLACTYGALIVYASLYPFSGWQTSGLPLFDFLGAPWPRDSRPDDLISNILGYIPLGFLITMGRKLALPDMVLLGMIMIGLTGVVIGIIINYFEKKLLAGIRR